MHIEDIIKIFDKFNNFENYGRRDLIKQYIKDEFISNSEKIYVLIYIANMPLIESCSWHKFVKSYVLTLVNFS